MVLVPLTLAARARRALRALGALRVAVALLLLAVAAACGVGGQDASPPAGQGEGDAPIEPCPDGATLELGDPFLEQAPAEFTTAGGTVHVTARSFHKGGIFDADIGRTVITVGPAGSPPAYDGQTGTIANAVAEARVLEGSWSTLELAPGRYWLWSSSGWDVAVRSCAPDGVSDPLPASPPASPGDAVRP